MTDYYRPIGIFVSGAVNFAIFGGTTSSLACLTLCVCSIAAIVMLVRTERNK